MIVVMPDDSTVEESSLERLLMRLEMSYPESVFYAWDDGSGIDMLDKIDGAWSEATKLEFESE